MLYDLLFACFHSDLCLRPAQVTTISCAYLKFTFKATQNTIHTKISTHKTCTEFQMHLELILVQVLDARDPLGTRSKQIENFLKKEKPHKHLLFLLNKCDLIPTWATVRHTRATVTAVFITLQTQWISILSAEYPTLAFHASTLHSFGKGALIQLLRQFAKVCNPNNHNNINHYCTTDSCTRRNVK